MIETVYSSPKAMIFKKTTLIRTPHYYGWEVYPQFSDIPIGSAFVKCKENTSNQS